MGMTPGSNGDTERALRSIKVPFLYMPSETDLCFPVGDARYEAGFMSTVSLVPIPSLWGHTAGAGGSAADEKFLNEKIGFWRGRVAALFPAAVADRRDLSRWTHPLLLAKEARNGAPTNRTSPIAAQASPVSSVSGYFGSRRFAVPAIADTTASDISNET